MQCKKLQPVDSTAAILVLHGLHSHFAVLDFFYKSVELGSLRASTRVNLTKCIARFDALLAFLVIVTQST